MHFKGTYTGHYEPVKEISDLLDEYEAKTGNYVPIHGSSTLIFLYDNNTHRFLVDGASGGFVSPFVTVWRIFWFHSTVDCMAP